MTANLTDEQAPAPIQTGIEGLDEVLYGGVTPNRLSLIEGSPGSGKTTLALQFLLEGVRRGEVCLFVTLSESEEELRAAAASHGWTLDGIEILELIASEESLKSDARYNMYHPSEVELGQTTKTVLAAADRIKPVRLVFDSLSEFRLLAEQPLRYRRQILALKQYFAHRQCTVLFIDDLMSKAGDMRLHSLVHAVVCLEQDTPEYGAMRRRLRVLKLRGRAFREGYHDFIIRRGGLEVFPRLVAAEHRTSYVRQTVKSGLEPLDALLGGGLAKGTSTLILGPAGTGKSSLATQFAWTAAGRGEHAALFLFDEPTATFRERSAGLGMDVEPMISAGRMSVRQVDPAELSPGEFAYMLRRTVEHDQTSMVVIDSLNGYLNAMPSERFLTLHMHELLSFLGQRGVTTLIPMTQHGIVGDMQGPVDASYLTDTVVLLRYFESFGQIRQAISVMKKRTGKHERTVRELHIDNGILIGETLQDFQGILTGVPHFVGSIAGLKENGR